MTKRDWVLLILALVFSSASRAGVVPDTKVKSVSHIAAVSIEK